MANDDKQQLGRVYLVGAGPGDPGMITLRAIECLRLAEVVLYDYLVNPKILRHANSTAELVCLGRHGHGRIWAQGEINDRLVELAKEGKNVVRLKGGDPAVFARGAQEAEYLASHNVPFEIVPGITAALAAGSCAGIPITHRDMASAVALVTGQESAKSETALDFDALAKFPGTLVFYMGVTTAKRWTKDLIAAGKSVDTPTAIVRRCSLPDQLTVRCTLGEVVQRLTSSEATIRPPAIVIVGEVTTLSDTLAWFERRPLFGQAVLVTRPIDQVEGLGRQLSDLGAEVIEQPAIEISDPPEWAPVDNAISRLDEFDWLVFSSVNGVRFFMDRLFALRDLRALGTTKLAAVGPKTAEKLEEYHLKVDVRPDEFRAEALAASLVDDAKGKSFLLARASRGREVLAEQLRSAGGIVEQVVVYESTDVTAPKSEIDDLFAAGRVDWITVTSSAIAKSLGTMFGDTLKQTQIASISPITSETLRELGYEPTVEAAEYTMDGIVEAIKQYAN